MVLMNGITGIDFGNIAANRRNVGANPKNVVRFVCREGGLNAGTDDSSQIWYADYGTKYETVGYARVQIYSQGIIFTF